MAHSARLRGCPGHEAGLAVQIGAQGEYVLQPWAAGRVFRSKRSTYAHRSTIGCKAMASLTHGPPAR